MLEILMKINMLVMTLLMHLHHFNYSQVINLFIAFVEEQQEAWKGWLYAVTLVLISLGKSFFDTRFLSSSSSLGEGFFDTRSSPISTCTSPLTGTGTALSCFR